MYAQRKEGEVLICGNASLRGVRVRSRTRLQRLQPIAYVALLWPAFVSLPLTAFFARTKMLEYSMHFASSLFLTLGALIHHAIIALITYRHLVSLKLCGGVQPMLATVTHGEQQTLTKTVTSLIKQQFRSPGPSKRSRHNICYTNHGSTTTICSVRVFPSGVFPSGRKEI